MMAYEHWMTAARLSDGKVCFWGRTDTDMAWIDIDPKALGMEQLFPTVEEAITVKLMEMEHDDATDHPDHD